MIVAEDKLLRISETMELLRLTRTTVIEWIDKGYLEEIRMPSGQRRIRLSQVEAIVSGEKETTPA